MDAAIDMDLSNRVAKLEYWRNGNGTPGAAETIVNHEDRIDEIEKHHLQEGEVIKKAVKEAMSERSKSREGLLRAFGPYFAAICAIVSAVLVAVLGG